MVKNKEYIIYIWQDSLLSAWLLSSINVSLLSQLVGCKTAREIWFTIEQIFSSHSSVKVMHYKRLMQNPRKDNPSTKEYLTKMKTYCDLLEAAGHKDYRQSIS